MVPYKKQFLVPTQLEKLVPLQFSYFHIHGNSKHAPYYFYILVVQNVLLVALAWIYVYKFGVIVFNKKQ